jgi:hypothetical protein
MLNTVCSWMVSFPVESCVGVGVDSAAKAAAWKREVAVCLRNIFFVLANSLEEDVPRRLALYKQT